MATYYSLITVIKVADIAIYTPDYIINYYFCMMALKYMLYILI